MIGMTMQRSGRGVFNGNFGGALARQVIITMVLTFVVMGAYAKDVMVRPVGTAIDRGKHYLKMRVWNCTRKDIEVHLADLPWGQYRLGLVLYPGGKLADEPLKENLAVGDSPSTEINIPAKGYVDGDIVLDERFFDIARYEKRGNLLVFWEYDLSLITGGKPDIVGGMVPLDGKKSSDDGHGVACK